MNTNEHDVVLSKEQELRAKLCAVLLGEASEADRAEVEAALAQSAELRAERARLEATIGLVSSSLKEDAGAADALSPQAAAALQAAAAKRARPVWYRSGAFRIAASFALFAGGVLAWQASVSTTATLDGLAVAQAEPESTPSAPAPRGSAVKDAIDGAPANPAENTPEAAPVEPSLAFAAAAAGGESVELRLGEIAALDNERKSGGITGQDLLALDAGDAVTWQGDAKTEQVFAQLRAQQLGVNVAQEQAGAPLEELRRLGYARGDSSTLYSGPGAAGAGNPGVTQYANGSTWLVTPSTPPAGPATPGANCAQGATTIGVGLAGSSGASRPTAGTPIIVGGGAGGGSFSNGATATLAPARAKSTAAPATTEPAPADALTGLGYLGDSKSDADDVKGRTFNEMDRFGNSLRFDEGGRVLEPDWPHRLEQFRYDCLPRRGERPRDMFFRYWGDNPFELAALDKLSTFSADVDTASYTLARRYLVDGHLPEKAQIRTEEFVNYFKGEVQPPTEGVFRIATELAPSLFGDSTDTWMLRVAVRGREVSKNERQPLALTFVIDVSGSMKEENRLELVKHALRLLVSQLDARDSIALVKFSTGVELVLPMTSAANKSLIESAIHPLHPDGSTNTEAGLRMGYEQALAALTKNATNRVVLLTDGVANVGIVDPNSLVAMVERQRSAGIYLNTVGVGMDNHNDNLLEQLANKGDGVCNYVDDEKEVRRALVDNFTGAFEPIARDVKLQVEFDPAQVERYRLLGYENRAVADADFRNDKVDAGEIGAGHQVVALYEIVRRSGGDGPLATVRLRYKPPHKDGVASGVTDEALEISHGVQARDAAGSFTATTAGYRRSVLVAQFAEFLRRSIHARYDSLDRLIDESKKLAGEMRDAEFDEFVAMVTKSRELVLRELGNRPPLERCFDELRHRCYLLEQIEELRRRRGTENALDDLDRTARDLEQRIESLRLDLERLQGQVDDATLSRIQAENVELQRKLIELLGREPSQQK